MCVNRTTVFLLFWNDEIEHNSNLVSVQIFKTGNFIYCLVN